MLTWLDHFCRRAMEACDVEKHGNDPRRAMAYMTSQFIHAAQTGRRPFDGLLDEAFYAILAPIVAPYLPEGVTFGFRDGAASERALGLILTRQTASLLSAVKSFDAPDELWREKVGIRRAIYVDIPHGALTFNTTPGKNDVVQLRAILAAPFFPPDRPGHTQFVVQLTDVGSEHGRGRVAGVLCPDGSIKRQANQNNLLATDFELQPPFVHPDLHKAVMGCAGTFLRLVLAYYLFGPPEAREEIAVTPTERLNKGKPRNGQSLFAMTRLQPSAKVGRPQNTIPSSWSLSERQEVDGHFKLQAYGSQWSQRRLIWVSGYERGPIDTPIRPKGVQI